MIPYERQDKIMQILTENSDSIFKIEKLNEKIPNISISTLRRDLKILEQNNRLKLLTGGGVKLIQSRSELSIIEKSTLQIQEKEYIAKLAAEQIQDKETVYIDSGSTCSLLLQLLVHRDINIFTTNTLAFSIFNNSTSKLIVPGGEYNPSISSLFGPITEENIKKFIFDKAFLGANGIDAKFGITTPSISESSKKRIVLEQSKKTYLMCDSSKFNTTSSFKVFDLKEVILITDKKDQNLSKEMKIIS